MGQDRNIGQGCDADVGKYPQQGLAGTESRVGEHSMLHKTCRAWKSVLEQRTASQELQMEAHWGLEGQQMGSHKRCLRLIHGQEQMTVLWILVMVQDGLNELLLYPKALVVDSSTRRSKASLELAIGKTAIDTFSRYGDQDI